MSIIRSCFFFILTFSATLHSVPTPEMWSSPIKVAEDSQDVHGPSIAVDPAGNSVVIWKELLDSHYVLKASTKSLNGTWTTPVILSPVIYNASAQKVVVDPNGNAIAIWTINEHYVQSANLPFGGSWTSPVYVSHFENRTRESDIGIDAQGNAVVIWTTSATNHQVKSATYFSQTSSWSTPVVISETSNSILHPRIAVNASGDAAAAWWVENQTAVQAATLPFGGSWTQLQTLGTGLEPAVAIDDEGNVAVAWCQYIGFQASTLPVGGSWADPVTISNTRFDTHNANIAFRIPGQLIVVWSTYESGMSKILSSTSKFGEAWNEPVLISIGFNESGLSMCVNAEGKCIVVWRSYNEIDHSYTIHTSTLIPNTLGSSVISWTEDIILSDPQEMTDSPSIGLDSYGHAVVVWTGWDTYVKSSDLIPIPIQPPTKVEGKQHRSGHNSVFNVVSWNPPLVSTPVEYRIFRDTLLTDLLGIVPSYFTDLSFTELHCDVGVYTYYIVSVDNQGRFSQIVRVTVQPKS